MWKFISDDIPNEKIKLLPLEVHFVVGGGLLKNKVKGGSL